MTIAPLTGPFIQAAGYSRGRPKGTPRWVVLHSAEGSRTVESLGNYFAGTKAGSSNAGMGTEGQYAEFVTYNNTPWTNPPINSLSDTMELCAFAAWDRAEWLSHPKMLEGAAHWAAWRCAVRAIPVRLVSGRQAHDQGMAGILDHARVNDGWHASDHRDVGTAFPWDIVIPRAQALGRVPAKVGSADRVLRVGMAGTDVDGVRHAMIFLGNKIPATGAFDVQLAEVVKVYQAHRGITPVDGVVGPATWTALRREPGLH